MSRTSPANKSQAAFEKEASYIIPCELAIVEARRHNYIADPDSRCVNFFGWEPPSTVNSWVYAVLKTVFLRLTEAGLVVPFIDCRRDGSVIMTWHNDSVTQPYFLYVQIVHEHSVRYEVTRNRVVNDDFTWKYIVDSSTLASTLKMLANYLQGKRNAA